TGDVLVADLGNSTIRRVVAARVVTTVAGVAGMDGSIDGASAAARFSSPSSVAGDSAGNFYVADSGNSTIRKISANEAVTTLAGMAGVSGSTDGVGAEARFSYPRSIAIDSAGVIYVADTDNSTIRKITAAGSVTTLAGTAGVQASTNGTGSEA